MADGQGFMRLTGNIKSILRSFFIIAISAISAPALTAQGQVIDSLKKARLLTQEDTNSVHALNKLAMELSKHDADSSIHFARQALKLSQKLSFQKGIIVAQLWGGIALTSSGKYKEAEKYLLEGLRLNQESGAPHLEMQLERTLSSLYEKTGREKAALHHYKKARALQATLLSEENKKQLVLKEMNFEFDKREAIARAEHKKELESQQAIADERNRRQSIALVFVAVGLLLVVVFAAFVFRSLRVTRSQRDLIEQQKEEVMKQKEVLDLKQHEIIDSITYAKRIQTALLASDLYISKTLTKLKG